MFTGLVEAFGRVAFARRDGEGMVLAVESRDLVPGLVVGESVALSGCCTTVTRRSGIRADFHMTRETLARTWFGGVEAGRLLNLERALGAASRLGGHFVQGHVDGLGEVEVLERRRDGADLRVALPADLLRYCAVKGSIALDGVSLTIAGLAGGRVTIALIPHTMEATTLGEARPGRKLHVEVDILAKYVERLLADRPGSGPTGTTP